MPPALPSPPALAAPALRHQVRSHLRAVALALPSAWMPFHQIPVARAVIRSSFIFKGHKYHPQRLSMTSSFKTAKPPPLLCSSVSPIAVLNIMHFCFVLSLTVYLLPGMHAPLRAGILSVLFPAVPLASSPGPVTADAIAPSMRCVQGAFAIYEPALATQQRAERSP